MKHVYMLEDYHFEYVFGEIYKRNKIDYCTKDEFIKEKKTEFLDILFRKDQYVEKKTSNNYSRNS